MSKTIQRVSETGILFFKKNGKRKKEDTGVGIAAALFSYAVLFLLSYANILLYDGVVEQDGAAWTYLLGTALLVLFFLLLYGSGIPEKTAHFLAGGMLLAWYLLCRASIYSGLMIQINEVLDRLGVYFGVYLPHFAAEDTGGGCYLAVIFVQALLIWLSTAGFFCIKRAVFTLLPGILLGVLSLSVGMSPDLAGTLFLALGAVGCLPFFHARGMKKSSLLKSVSTRAGAITLFSMLIFLMLSATVGEHYVTGLVEKHDEAMAYQRYVEEWIKKTLDFGIFNSRPGGVSNRSPKYRGETVMTVRLSGRPKGTCYLRGYVGDTYQGGSWGNSGASAFEAYEGENKSVSIDDSGKEILNFVYGSEKEFAGGETEQMTIEYKNTDDIYAYLPYGADLDSVSGENGGTGMSVYGDAMLLREETDMLSLSGCLTGTHFGNFSASVSDRALEKEYLQFAERYLEVPEGLKQINSLGDWLSRKLSEDYGDFYYLSDSGLYLSRSEIAVCLVQREIAKRVSYSVDLDDVPIGEDVVQHFLFGSNRGFCQHYASAGTLLLRKLGVPARYVTGYAVSEGEFILQPDGSYLAEVKDSDAHAWVEYYKEGAGWLPADMTEGSNGISENLFAAALKSIDSGTILETAQEEAAAAAPENNEPQQTAKEPQEKEELQTAEKTPQTEKQAEKQTENNIKQPQDDRLELKDEPYYQTKEGNHSDGAGSEGFGLRIFAAAAAVLCVIILIAAAVRYAGEKKRKRLFGQKDYRKAVKSINGYLYRLLRKKRYLKKKPADDREYKELAEKGAPMDEWEHYFELVWLAYYSDEELTGEDAAFCDKVYKKVILLK